MYAPSRSLNEVLIHLPVMIVSACMFIWGYAMTWGPGIWILIGETFPTRTRAKQGALATASNWFWNFLLAFFTPFIVSAIHFRYGFIFACSSLSPSLSVSPLFSFLIPFSVQPGGKRDHLFLLVRIFRSDSGGCRFSTFT